MKKIFLTAALLLAGITVTLAGNDRPITVDKLPAAAQNFLKSYFSDLTVAYAVEDPKFAGSEYEVTYTDRTEVEFDTKGEWTSVERKYTAVPRRNRSEADHRLRRQEQLPEPGDPQDRAQCLYVGDRAYERTRDQFDRNFRVIDIDD